MEISYEEAKRAKETLLAYLKPYVESYSELDSHRSEKVLYFALTEDYFLE